MHLAWSSDGIPRRLTRRFALRPIQALGLWPTRIRGCGARIANRWPQAAETESAQEPLPATSRLWRCGMDDPLSYSVAVIADIHGNVAALNAVLEDLHSQPYDRLVVAGDLVLNGPRPVESLDAIRNLGAPTIYGNTNLLVFDEQYSEERLDWVREKLGTDGLTYLKGLRFEYRITPPEGQSPEDDLLIVHATPTDVTGLLVLQPVPFSLRTVTPEEEARTLLGDAKANLIVAGHLFERCVV